MESLHISRQLLAHLARKSAKELALYIGLILVITITLSIGTHKTNTHNSMHYSDSTTLESTNIQYLDPSKRLGYSILSNAGLVTASYADEPTTFKDKINYYQVVYSKTTPPYLSCTPNSSYGPIKKYNKGIDVISLTKAIFAAEVFNRPKWIQTLEIFIATTLNNFGFTEQISNMSLGASQLNFSIAKKLLEEKYENTFSNADVLSLLKNDCYSFSLAYRHIINIGKDTIKESDTFNQLIENIAIKYNGSKTENINSLRYIDAVRNAYYILENNDDFIMPKDKIVSSLCLKYTYGSIDPIYSYDDLPETTKDNIYFDYCLEHRKEIIEEDVLLDFNNKDHYKACHTLFVTKLPPYNSLVSNSIFTYTILNNDPKPSNKFNLIDSMREERFKKALPTKLKINPNQLIKSKEFDITLFNSNCNMDNDHFIYDRNSWIHVQISIPLLKNRMK